MKQYYKYTDTRGLAAILVGNSLKFSRPRDFNDPFDVRIGSIVPDNLDQYLHDMGKEFHEIMCSEFDQSLLQPELVIRDKIILINNTLKSMSPESKKNFTDEFLAASPLYNKENILKLMREQQAELNRTVNNLGVFSCCQNFDQPRMWAHYADDHKGAVIGLRADLPNDSALQLLKPVRYVDEFAEYTQAKKMVHMQLFMTPQKMAEAMLEMLFYDKARQWESEQEHRLTILDYIPDDKPYQLLPLHKGELTDIYFGMKFDTTHQSKLMMLAAYNHPHVKFYKMDMAGNAYSMVAKAYN